MGRRMAICRVTSWRGWAVVSLAACGCALSLGPAYYYSIFLLCFQEEFHTSTAITGWVGSVAHGLICLGCVVPLALLRRFSSRTVIFVGIVLNCGGFFATAFVPSLGYAFLTYSLAVGLGSSFMYQTSISLCLAWFPTKHCTRATTLISLGGPCGTLVSGPILTALISSLGWRHAFMIFSAGAFLLSVAAALFLTDPVAPPQHKPAGERDADSKDDAAETTEKLTGQPSLDGKRVEGDPTHGVSPFYRWCLPCLFFVGILVSSAAWNFVSVNLASFMDSIGLVGANISVAIVVIAVGEIVGKILLFVFGDVLPFSQLYVIAASNVAGGVISGVLTLISTLAPMIVLLFFFGVMKSCLIALAVSTSMEIFHKYGTGVVSMLVLVPLGIGILISAPLLGGLYDLTGDYTMTLLVLAALLAFSTGCLLLIPVTWRIRSWRRRMSQRSIELQEPKYTPIEAIEEIEGQSC